MQPGSHRGSHIAVLGGESAGMVLWVWYASLDRTSLLRVHKNSMRKHAVLGFSLSLFCNYSMLAHSQVSLATMPLPVSHARVTLSCMTWPKLSMPKH